MLKVAILDDYQNVSQQFVDLEKLSGKYEFKIFSEPFIDEADALDQLADFEALLIMRERTPMTKKLIENLTKFRKFNNEKNFKKVVLFTSPYHMKRSLIVSKKMGLNLYPYYWKKEWKYNISIINYYQSFSFVKNIRSFDLFFKEILGILSLYLIDFK